MNTTVLMFVSFPYAEYAEANKFVKLFIGSVPRTVTEADIRPLFEEHGNVLEVALLKDRKTGLQQGFCFVKYATSEEADRAISALHNQYTLPGAFTPLQVRYADGDRERQEDKLFVGSLNKHATEQEIAAIFSPYGQVADVYLMRDELKQSRGCGFVKFLNREMASAAMNALHGTYIMRGCDQPLIVRFADPKRPRPEQRGGPAFGGPGFGNRSETATVNGPTTKFDIPRGGRVPPNSWGPVSPQSRAPSQAGSQGFGNKSGAVETSLAVPGSFGETGGLSGGHQLNFPAISSQQGFNPSMLQTHSAPGQQMPALQKPLMTAQHFTPSLQPVQNQQMPGSHPQVQTLQPPMQQIGQLQVSQATGLPSSQSLPSQQLPGLSGQLSASQPSMHPNVSANTLQTPLGLPQQGMGSIANHQQLPSSTQSQQLLPRPMQQMPQLPQMLLQQQAQALQSSVQSSQQAIFQLQQQLQVMQQAQQQVPQNVKQQSPWSGPQPNSGAPAITQAAVMPLAASVTSPMPVTTTTAVPSTCSWTEHTSPEGFKYYYNSVTQESKWEKPEEYALFEQQQQQQQQKLLLFQQQPKLAVQQLQSPAQTQPQMQVHPQTQIQPNQQISQAQQVQAQMQLRQQAQLQLLQPSQFQGSSVGNQQNIQDFNYAQLQAVNNSVSDGARIRQGIQFAQELSWQNKPSGA